jgi:surface polysaccharide O-acyltransferase-like enzyme
MDWEDSKESFVIFKALFKDGTAYFIFIAGFLFQYLSKKYAYGDYLKKKFNNVILPYLIISIPAIFYCISQGKVSNDVWFKDFFPSWPLPYQVVALYSTGGHLYTLWFIPMIAIFYVISPLLIFVDKNPKLYWSLLLLIPSGLVFPDQQFMRFHNHFYTIFLFTL